MATSTTWRTPLNMLKLPVWKSCKRRLRKADSKRSVCLGPSRGRPLIAGSWLYGREKQGSGYLSKFSSSRLSCLAGETTSPKSWEIIFVLASSGWYLGDEVEAENYLPKNPTTTTVRCTFLLHQSLFWCGLLPLNHNQLESFSAQKRRRRRRKSIRPSFCILFFLLWLFFSLFHAWKRK